VHHLRLRFHWAPGLASRVRQAAATQLELAPTVTAPWWMPKQAAQQERKWGVLRSLPMLTNQPLTPYLTC
jgi:hypothetical protein